MKVQGDMDMSLSDAVNVLIELKHYAQLLDRTCHCTKVILAINKVTEFVNDSVELFSKISI